MSNEIEEESTAKNIANKPPQNHKYSYHERIFMLKNRRWKRKLQLQKRKKRPSNVYSGLISLRTDWCDLAVQGTLKSLLQHHSLKASILQRSAFFILQLSHLFMTTGKTITLTGWTSVGKVMSTIARACSLIHLGSSYYPFYIGRSFLPFLKL